MKIEHVAFNVANANETAAWYVENLGMTVVRRAEENQTHFLADDSGTVLVELYSNPAAPVPDYAAMHPLMLHLALVSNDIEADKERLLAAGATLFSDQSSGDGTRLVMLRDPWNFAIQLCKRGKSMLRGQ
ncbi:MAG TPA: VOC family protein [Roseiflexaceae bacterium]|nr:VOC family protein [Roseiflexaceae bacterium]